MPLINKQLQFQSWFWCMKGRTISIVVQQRLIHLIHLSKYVQFWLTKHLFAVPAKTIIADSHGFKTHKLLIAHSQFPLRFSVFICSLRKYEMGKAATEIPLTHAPERTSYRLFPSRHPTRHPSSYTSAKVEYHRQKYNFDTWWSPFIIDSDRNCVRLVWSVLWAVPYGIFAWIIHFLLK